MALPSKWVVASAVLVLFSLGLSGVLRLLTSVLLVLCGCLTVLYAVTRSGGQEEEAGRISGSRQEWGRRHRRPRERSGSAGSSSRPPVPPASIDSQLTGVPLIDEQLHLIISYLMRDHVHAWQCGLTHTNDFPQRVQQTLQFVISSLSDKVRRVDWMPFLTTR